MSEYIKANAHSIEIFSLRQSLIKWGKKNFRVFPWRMTRDPYKILISEVMLHRTQAKQVVFVYEQFIQAYPDIESLMQASKIGIDISKDTFHASGIYDPQTPFFEGRQFNNTSAYRLLLICRFRAGR